MAQRPSGEGRQAEQSRGSEKLEATPGIEPGVNGLQLESKLALFEVLVPDMLFGLTPHFSIANNGFRSP